MAVAARTRFRLDKIMERTMAMDDAAWARHANPWSVWTRIPLLPLFLLAIWSHHWWGWWALLPLAVLAGWAWLNPRVFGRPASTENWASKATFGERIWLARDDILIPTHHARAATLLAVLAGAGTAIAVIAAFAGSLGWCVGGGVTAFLAKLWFVDRMVWLYEDMKDKDPDYVSWSIKPARNTPV